MIHTIINNKATRLFLILSGFFITNALIAEFIGCEIARALGFKVPELVFATLDSSFGRIEGDEEIQDLLKASVGLNLGVHFLSGAITFDPVTTTIDSLTASRIVWLDSFRKKDKDKT